MEAEACVGRGKGMGGEEWETVCTEWMSAPSQGLGLSGEGGGSWDHEQLLISLRPSRPSHGDPS